jgi:hypothetical protein
MAGLKQRGDSAEMQVAADVMRRGHKVALPFGEDWDYDLIVCRSGSLERIRVKYTRSDGRSIIVRCRSHSLTNGRVRAIKRYTAQMIDWIAVYDATTDACYYVPSSDFEHGRSEMRLRLEPARNGQRRRIRWARDYLAF